MKKKIGEIKLVKERTEGESLSKEQKKTQNNQNEEEQCARKHM